MGKASRKRVGKPADDVEVLEGELGAVSLGEGGEEGEEDDEEVETIKVNLDDMKVRRTLNHRRLTHVELSQAGKWAKEKMDAEVQRLSSMGQKSIIMKTMKLFVEHDTEAETFTNCIEDSPPRTNHHSTLSPFSLLSPVGGVRLRL
jgi:hypothetical protein